MLSLASMVGWLAGTKVGRYLSAAILGAVAISLAVARIFAKGRDYEKAKDRETKLIELQNANNAVAEVSKLSRRDRIDYVGEWVRDPD